MNVAPAAAPDAGSTTWMLLRFCLYGFLKNQRYFEPFFMLALLAHDLSFFEIGLLYACRSLTLNLLEIPSGAIADHWGRRRSMIGSFAAYICSFLLFAYASQFGWLALAMVLYGIGDSFRTGTHKAMIFQWLKNQNRQSERTQVYGVTRSWSQYGSAVSALIAAAFVIQSGDFRTVFLISIVPYLLNIVNFLGYPLDVDGAGGTNAAGPDTRGGRFAIVEPLRSTVATLVRAVRHRRIRRLIFESMAWEGVFGAIKDYLQPALLALVLMAMHQQISTATPLEVDAASSTSPQVVWTISVTYTVLFLLSGWASRSAHRLVVRAGSHAAAAQWLWWGSIGLYLILGVSDWWGWTTSVVLAFVTINILQNVWRPILVSRFDDHTAAHSGATMLSIESQAQRLATLFVAPLVGWMIDLNTRQAWPGRFWPIALVGIAAALLMLKKNKSGSLWGKLGN